jgi:diguanylate cyclase
MLELARAGQKKAPEPSGAPQPGPEYKAAEALACKALLLADTYQTPPVPKTYEVWYSYAAGVPEEVAGKINAIIEKNGSLGTYDLDQIHLEYLALSERERKRQDALNFHLDREMDEIAKLVQAHIASSDSYSGSLKHTGASLSASATPAQVRSAIEILLSENAKMRSQTAKLGSALAESRAQVRKLRTSLERSREKEMRDPMTNLANRRYFELQMPREIAESRRNGTPMCLALVDIDHFKVINDTFGHPVGDDVLRFFAALLAENVKGRDLAARYGGEEFALILPATAVGNAQQLVQQIMDQLKATNLVLSQGKTPIGRLTASFGIARLRDSDDSETLLMRADTRLYEAKNAGRNRIASDA